MSVVVLGMEMPENCHECRLCMQEADTELGVCAYCGLTGFGWEAYSDRPDWCPLRSLPKRHGRLIEAERLRAEFPYPSEGMGGWKNPDEALVHKTGIWAAIDCAETIVEAEGD